MSKRFGLIAAAAVVMLAGVGLAADPTGTVSVASGYTAGNPAKAKPYGSFSVSLGSKKGDEYQVLVDYGTYSSNTFTKWTGPAEYVAGVRTQMGVTDSTWGPAEEVSLQNAPANLQVRARLQWRSASNLGWNTLHTSITPCP